MVEIDPEMGGAKRVIVAMCRSENAEDVMVLAKRYIAPGTTIFTDENPAYNQLDTCFQHFVVNHSEEYSTLRETLILPCGRSAVPADGV